MRSRLIAILTTQVSVQPRLRQAPSPDHRRNRDPEDLGDLLVLQAAEEPQLDDPRQLGIELRQPFQGDVDVQHVRGLLRRELSGLVEGQLPGPSASLGIAVAARMIDQNATHHLRGESDEVQRVAPLHPALIDQSHEGFVNERRGLEGMTGTLVTQIACGKPVEFLVNERCELVERGLIAVAPLDQQPRDVACRLRSRHRFDPDPGIRFPPPRV